MYLQYTIYDKRTGTIVRIGGCEEKDFPKSTINYAAILGKYDIINWYFDGTMPKKKRVMVLTVNGQRVVGVPVGSRFRVKEVKDAIIVNNEDEVLSVDMPGEYHVIVEHPHYYPGEVTIKIN